jgi:hypothetical protein
MGSQDTQNDTAAAAAATITAAICWQKNKTTKRPTVNAKNTEGQRREQCEHLVGHLIWLQ